MTLQPCNFATLPLCQISVENRLGWFEIACDDASMQRWIRRTVTVTITERWTLTWDLPNGEPLAIVSETVTRSENHAYRALYPTQYSMQRNLGKEDSDPFGLFNAAIGKDGEGAKWQGVSE